MRFSGIAAQSTTTSGPLARGDASWIALATSSLPVPVSPWTSTDDSVGATRASTAKRRRIGTLAPTIDPKRSSGWGVAHGDRVLALGVRPGDARERWGQARGERLLVLGGHVLVVRHAGRLADCACGRTLASLERAARLDETPAISRLRGSFDSRRGSP